jgi:glyoxylase-like metal-dependent hydrolase (beta-lactamase superfamily II)
MAATSAGDAVLAGLGIRRLVLPVPFADAGGPVNVYALEDEGGWALFDCGIGTPEGEAALRAGAVEQGVDLKRCTRLFVSHGHVDHYGLAQALSEESGAKVFIHPADSSKAVGPDTWDSRAPLYRAFLQRAGVPVDQLDRLSAMGRFSGKYSRRIDPERALPLSDGQQLGFRCFEAEVLHLPGHTPGLVCLYDAGHRLLFADDHILARTSPNPFLELAGELPLRTGRALVHYFASLRRVLALEIDWVLPGHGEPFQDVHPLMERLFGFYARRQDKLLLAMAAGVNTVYALTQALFGPHDGPRLYLTVSEVVGNLEVMEDEGRVVSTVLDGLELWAAVE